MNIALICMVKGREGLNFELNSCDLLLLFVWLSYEIVHSITANIKRNESEMRRWPEKGVVSVVSVVSVEWPLFVGDQQISDTNYG